MIHKFKIDETNIVVDVNSGAVHEVDDLIYDILDCYGQLNAKEIGCRFGEKYSPEEISEGIEEIKELEENGLIFSKDEYTEKLSTTKPEPVVKALCLHISHDCNLRCKYCFASYGHFGGDRGLMKTDVGKKAIDLLIEKSGSRKNLEIDFFGGEPLLNFDTVKEIIEYAKSKEVQAGKNFRFTITTNATLLNNDIKDYINSNISNVVLSIDGRKSVNDNMRKKINNIGTYEQILPQIMEIAASREQQNYYVRGTYTRDNLDFSKDVLHLADLGFKQISIEPVVAEEWQDYALHKEDLPILFEQYENLAKEYLKRDKTEDAFNFFHFMIDLDQGPCVTKRMSGCGAGHEYLAVTPEGDIYPCHQFVGNEEYKIGSVFENEINKDIQMQFKNTNIYSKSACNNCWAKFYCSGGCHASAYKFNNNINIPYEIGCQLEKKRVECALYIATKRKDWGKQND